MGVEVHRDTGSWRILPLCHLRKLPATGSNPDAPVSKFQHPEVIMNDNLSVSKYRDLPYGENAMYSQPPRCEQGGIK